MQIDTTATGSSAACKTIRRGLVGVWPQRTSQAGPGGHRLRFAAGQWTAVMTSTRLGTCPGLRLFPPVLKLLSLDRGLSCIKPLFFKKLSGTVAAIPQSHRILLSKEGQSQLGSSPGLPGGPKLLQSSITCPDSLVQE
ncbi:hypothetical protein CB1_000228034 [Camelus ferus]|nr:hypothetical protein CB1_000228034 [Camelus ferus]